MPPLFSDLRLGFRTLSGNPGFTLAAVLTLGLGIGANLGMLSVANALFLRPLPFIASPDRLAWVVGVERETGRAHGASYPDAVQLGALRDLFDGVLAQARVEVNFAGPGQPARVSGLLVSQNYFSVLGVRPALGRGFLDEENRTPGTHPVAIIADGLWRREFGGDPSALGRQATINGRLFTLVGVLPAGFVGAEFADRPADVYLPVMMAAQAAPQLGDVLAERGTSAFSLLARLRPGVSIERAAAAVETVLADRGAAPAGAGIPTTRYRLEAMSGALHPNERTEGLALGALGLAIAGVVLLIACANIAALLLGRATGRRREMAIRLAIGASRSRLVRQLLTESLLLSLLAGMAGLLLAAWTTSAALAALKVPVQFDVSPDARVVLAAFGLAAAAALLFGTAPALAASRTEITPALSDGAAGSGMPRARRRLQRAFVVAQVALSLMLLASGTLLLRSLQAATRTDIGVDASARVLTASFDLSAQGYAPERVRRMSDLLLERVRSLPGVRSASIAGSVPLGGVMWGMQAQVDDGEASARPAGVLFVNHVRTDFFRTVGMRLNGGRDFADTDDEAAPRVAIVSETMAKRTWPGRNPIGRRFRMGGEKAPWITVVGVASDTVDGPGERPRPFVYLPLLQRAAWRSPDALLVRTAESAAPLAAVVAAEVRRLDSSLPVFGVATLEDIASERLLPRRAGSTIVAAFGLLALGLAAVGLYGVVSYTVSQRRREIGVRMALGADHRAIVRMVLGEGFRVAAAGVGVGLALSAAATWLLASMFPTVSPWDPAAWGTPAAIVVATVMIASGLPAARAARTDPVSTLRSE
jgi:predicted permease